MKKAILICAVAAACGVLTAGDSPESIARDVVALERTALDGWLTGNPDPFLAIADPDITYFHAVASQRLDGLPAVRALLESYRGMPLFDSYEIAAPKVQSSGDTAILTYVLVRHAGNGVTRWNTTQIYQRKKPGWRIVHSHYSQANATQP